MTMRQSAFGAQFVIGRLNPISRHSLKHGGPLFGVHSFSDSSLLFPMSDNVLNVPLLRLSSAFCPFAVLAPG